MSYAGVMNVMQHDVMKHALVFVCGACGDSGSDGIFVRWCGCKSGFIM